MSINSGFTTTYLMIAHTWCSKTQIVLNISGLQLGILIAVTSSYKNSGNLAVFGMVLSCDNNNSLGQAGCANFNNNTLICSSSPTDIGACFTLSGNKVPWIAFGI